VKLLYSFAIVKIETLVPMMTWGWEKYRIRSWKE